MRSKSDLMMYAAIVFFCGPVVLLLLKIFILIWMDVIGWVLK